MTMKGRPVAERTTVVVIGVAFAAAVYLQPGAGVAWAMIAIMLVAALVLSRPDDMPTASARLASAGFGIFYVAGLIVSLPLLHREAPPAATWGPLPWPFPSTCTTGATSPGTASA